MIFLAGRTARGNDLERSNIQNKSLANYLPQIEVSGEIAPSNTKQDEAVREDLLIGGYDDWVGVRTSREYKGLQRNIILNVKQPISKNNLNFRLEKNDASGPFIKWEDWLEGRDFNHWEGTYSRNKTKINAFFSKEFQINPKNKKKWILEPKIGISYFKEDVTGVINPDDYDYLIWNYDEESWDGLGVLLGANAKFKNMDASIEYQGRKGKNNYILIDSTYKHYPFIATTQTTGDLLSKDIGFSLIYKPNSKEGILKDSKIKFKGNLVNNIIINTGEDPWGNDNWRDFSNSCFDYRIDYEKELKKNLYAESGIAGIVNLGSSGEVVYSKKSSPRINAGIRYKINLSKIRKIK